jgi:hypothetical protein
MICLEDATSVPLLEGETTMEAQFWIDSWHIGGAKINFYRREIQPYLSKHRSPVTLQDKRILVPPLR